MVLEGLDDLTTSHAVPPLWRATGVALLLGFLSFATRQLNLHSWDAGGVTILWPTNAFLLGILLSNPKRHWAAYLGLGFLIDVSLNLSLHDTMVIALYLSTCNMAEVLLAALLLYPVIAAKPDLTERKQLVAFLVFGVFLAPAFAALAASVAQDGVFGWPTLHNFNRWFTADALGIATVTPLCLAFNQKKPFAGRSKREVFGLFALLCMVTVGVFWQSQYPFLFMMIPVFLLLGIRLGLAGSALGLLLVSILGGFLLTAGHGPVALMKSSPLAGRDLVFQLFVAISMLLLYIVEVLTAEGQRLQANLRGSERRFRLLAQASRDIISLTDLEGVRHYVSPASVEVLGYRPEEVIGGSFRELVHPEDVAEFKQLLEDLRAGKSPYAVEYRCQRADGSYVWLETNPRLYNDPDTGEPAGFVNVTRDISLRKAEEERQQRAFETIEQLASSDALTGIANRRQFDLVLEREWHRAAREQTSLSLLLIDVDRFKPYNDFYGHLTGDQCLRQVVDAIRPVVARPSDLLARYGGEEFAVVLPSTDAEGACLMGEWVRQAVELCRLPHPGNPPHSVITLSIGCATLTPRPEITHLHLIEAADQALYRAKSSGRNRVQLANEVADRGSVLLTG
jgi:diguanylate cyclase (GGDEF)-like protein/PAS domain S-box-containing protein